MQSHNGLLMSSKMKSWISNALALVLISASTKPCFAEDASRQTGVNTSQSTSHFKKQITLTADLDYLIYQPKEAVKASNKKFPTILFLHGSGERGTNVWDVTKHGPPHLVKEGKDFPFVVISPQCAPGEQWQTESLFVFIQEIKTCKSLPYFFAILQIKFSHAAIRVMQKIQCVTNVLSLDQL